MAFLRGDYSIVRTSFEIIQTVIVRPAKDLFVRRLSLGCEGGARFMNRRHERVFRIDCIEKPELSSVHQR